MQSKISKILENFKEQREIQEIFHFEAENSWITSKLLPLSYYHYTTIMSWHTLIHYKGLTSISRPSFPSPNPRNNISNPYLKSTQFTPHYKRAISQNATYIRLYISFPFFPCKPIEYNKLKRVNTHLFIALNK